MVSNSLMNKWSHSESLLIAQFWGVNFFSKIMSETTRGEFSNNTDNVVIIYLLKPDQISGLYCFNEFTCRILIKIRVEGRG